MINIVKTKLENKTNNPFVYYFNKSKITLNPGKPVIIEGDIFSKESRQEGNTENLLVNIYNGLIELTLIYDKTFINKVEPSDVVYLPRRAASRLIDKSDKTVEPKTEEPKKEVKVEEPKVVAQEEPKAAAKEEPKKEVKVEEPKVVAKEEPKVEVKDAPKKEIKKEEKVASPKKEASLEDTVVEDSTKKAAKITKL